ncbi:uncharacterized protein LOC134274256 [Saccostrea cucullata]|uniref:uncharacterized protein LOC134274256 n=1 Tax=Saccostrea cuccullata TaxID=36930 RepID=UPI002ED3F37E
MVDKKSTLSFESWVGKLNGKWTPLVFLTLGILAFLYPVCFNPIECAFPAEFTPVMVDYEKARCYNARTIRKVPWKPSDHNPYHCYFFRIPFMIWNLTKKKLGIHFIVPGSGEKDEFMKGNNVTVLKPSPFFPQHIMCNYTYTVYQHTRKYSDMCTLTLNPFLEHMVMVAWLWLILCISATIADGDRLPSFMFDKVLSPSNDVIAVIVTSGTNV